MVYGLSGQDVANYPGIYPNRDHLRGRSAEGISGQNTNEVPDRAGPGTGGSGGAD